MKKKLMFKMKFISTVLLICFSLNVLPVFADGSSEEFYEKFVIEAEEGILDANNSTENGGFEIKVDQSASGGKVLYSDTYYMTLDENITPVTYTINVTNAGRYNIFIKASSGVNDSIFCSINESGFKSYNFKQFSQEKYVWVFISTVDFTEGENSIKLANREAGLNIDKILITNEIHFYPSGSGDENALSSIYEKPSYYPPVSHPRLLTNPDELDSIRKNLNHTQNIADYNKVVASSIATVTGKYGGATQNVKNYAYIESNAFLYLIDNSNKENATKAVECLLKFLPTVDLSNEGSSSVTRTAGYIIYIASEVYDWCYNEIKPWQKEEIVQHCLKLATYMEIGFPPVKNNAYGNEHSMESMLLKDLLSFSIAVYNEHPEIYDIVAGRIFNEHIPVLNYHFEENNSSMHPAGDDYGTTRLTYSLFLATILDKMGCGDAVSEKQKEMAYQSIIRRRPDGYYLTSGDSWSKRENKPNNYNLAFLASNLYSDALLKQEYFNEIKKIVSDGVEYSNGSVSPVNRLLLNDVTLEGFPIDSIALTHFSGKEQGVMTARTGWEDDSMLVSLKLPERNFAGHAHLDAGAFEIYYKGALALDSGVYNGSPFYDENGNYITNVEAHSEHNLNYNHRTIAHNSMLIYDENEKNFGVGSVNDGGQRQETSFSGIKTFEDYKNANKIGTVLGYDYGPSLNAPSYTYLKGNITNAYSDKVTDYTRSFLFFNFFDEIYPGALIVMDKVTSKDAGFKKTWLLHSQNEPVIDGNTQSFSNKGGRLVNETLLPRNAVINIIGGEGKEYYVDGKNYTAIPRYENHDESGNYRIEISPQNESKTDYFLNVLQVSDDDNSIVPLKSTMYESEEFLGVKIKDRVAFLSKNDEKIDNTVTITVDGEGVIQYVVCGLSYGTWKIENTNKNFSYETIATISGEAVFFEAPCGSYTLTKINSSEYEKDFSIATGLDPNFNKYIKSGDYLVKVSETNENYNGISYSSPYLLVTANVTKLSGYNVTYGVKLYEIDKGSSMIVDPIEVEAIGMSDKGNFGLLFYGNGLKKGSTYYAYPYAKYEKNGETNTAYGQRIDITMSMFEECMTNLYNKKNNIFLYCYE